jgi:hypothetical protein
MKNTVALLPFQELIVIIQNKSVFCHNDSRERPKTKAVAPQPGIHLRRTTSAEDKWKEKTKNRERLLLQHSVNLG